MKKINFTGNDRGFILITAYMVIAVLVILSTGFSATSLSEQRIANKERDLAQALWIAEAGLDTAIQNLPDTPLSGAVGRGAYSSTTEGISAVRFLITSRGGIPAADETNPANTVRIIKAIVEQPADTADPSGITSAITASGDVVVKGSAEVNGTIDDNYTFIFDTVFGTSKETMKNNAANTYTNPSNNVTPVNSLTWINLDSGNNLQITDSGWEGSGILIVDGNARITGGHFSGIIWVIGTLWISGNPVIDGAIYVESGAEFDTTITGNPVVNYDTDAVSGAFSSIPSGLPPYIVNWKEE